MKIDQSHGVRIHAYADDLQTYFSSKAVNQIAAIYQIQSWVEDIDGWMSKRLKFNVDKTEFFWFGIRQQLLKVTQQSLVVNGVGVAPVSKVRDLGVLIDKELTLAAQVNQVVSGCFYQLRQLRSIRRSLPFYSQRALVTAFISSLLDYCNTTWNNCGVHEFSLCWTVEESLA